MPKKHAEINLFAFIGNNKTDIQDALESAVAQWLKDESTQALSREVYFGEEVSLDKVNEAYNTVSMFSTKKALIFRHFEKVSTGIQNELASILAQHNESTGVFLEAEKWTLKSPLKSLFEKKGRIQNFPLPYSNKIPDWIINRCNTKYHRSISKQDAYFLWECVGDNLQELEYELNKLHLFLEQKAPITVQSIQEVILPHRNQNFFELQKYIGLRDKGRTLLSLSNLLDQGTPPFLIAIRLFHHFLKLLKIRTYLEKGMPAKEIAGALNINQFIFDKEQYIKQAMTRTPLKLKKALAKLSSLELDFKQGKYPQRFESEMVFAELI